MRYALEFAKEAHDGQVRKFSGEPYFKHVYRVDKCVTEETDNPDIWDASALHDIIEDCHITRPELAVYFNETVASIVYELTNQYTKQTHPELKRSQRKHLELDRISRISYSAKLIKLADRIDNLIDLKLNDPKYIDAWLEGKARDYYYIKESRDLLEVLRGVNPKLEKVLESLV
jgi:(p)ppGpp synthase/HD superfamily hydrolase